MATLVLGSERKNLASALAMPESKRYLCFYFIMVLGIPFAYHKGVALDGVIVKYLGNMLFFVLLVTYVNSFQRLKALMMVVCASTLAYGFFGGLIMGMREGRIGVFGNAFDPNDTAFVLLSLFPPCLFFVRFKNGLLIRLVAIVASCSALAVILLTGSRGGMLGLGAILLLMLLTRIGGINSGQKILFTLLIVATAFLFRDMIDLDRYMTIADLSSDYNASSEGGRIDLWTAAIKLAAAHPITGVGVECFAFAQYLLRERAGAEYLGWLQPHNSLLQIASEVGVIGFAIFMFIIVRSLVVFYRAGSTGSSDQSPIEREFSGLAGLLFLGFCGLLVSGFFLSQAYSNFFTFYFALAAVTRKIYDNNPESVGSNVLRSRAQ